MVTNEALEQLRAFGARQKEAGNAARTQEDWKQITSDIPPSSLAWGDCWRQNIVYRVDDFDAEIGFYMGVLGMKPMILNDRHAMVTADGDFCLMIYPATPDKPATPPTGLTIELMLTDAVALANEMQARGAQFERFPSPEAEGSPLYRGQVNTPNGIPILLWSMAQVQVEVGTEEAAS